MKLATREDYQNGAIYTRYPPPPEVYARRARLLQGVPEPILVVGCGFGGLVQALAEQGKQVWGTDASTYMVKNRVNERVIHANILDLDEWLLGQFETLITEDLLPCLTDGEALVAARNCQALAPIVIHLVTEYGQARELNYHSTAEWMKLTQQLTVSLEGM
jgi:2-polyprenyl-3-methyl-5-hydroxy-6-metoxy-1,4-benzoquinol methylase